MKKFITEQILYWGIIGTYWILPYAFYVLEKEWILWLLIILTTFSVVCNALWIIDKNEKII